MLWVLLRLFLVSKGIFPDIETNTKFNRLRKDSILKKDFERTQQATLRKIGSEHPLLSENRLENTEQQLAGVKADFRQW